MTKLKIGEKALKFFTGEILKANENDHTVIGVASHESPDRDGDVIRQTGWDLKNFKNNPVMPWGHDYHGLPVAKIVRTWIDGKKLMFEAKFAGVDQSHPFAETVFQLFRDGFLNAFSVGFIPKEMKPNPATGGYFIEKAELLEISAVLVPAHQAAIATSVKSIAERCGKNEEEVLGFLKKAFVTEEAAPTAMAKAIEEADNELRYQVREVHEFKPESIVTREFQKEPAIFGAFGVLRNDDKEELKLHILRFPKTDWEMEEVKSWIEENKEKLANKEYRSDETTISFLSKLLKEKHAETKAMRKLLAELSEIVGVTRTANELETIEEIGLKTISLLKTIDLIQSETKQDVVVPGATQPATKAARPADLVDSFLTLAAGM